MRLGGVRLEAVRLEGGRLEGVRVEGPRLKGPGAGRAAGIPAAGGPRLEGPRLEGAPRWRACGWQERVRRKGMRLPAGVAAAISPGLARRAVREVADGRGRVPGASERIRGHPLPGGIRPGQVP